MKYVRGLKNKVVLLASITILMFGGVMPFLFPQPVGAAVGLLGSRSIKMSTSVAGATATYTITFTTATTGYPLKGIVIDFCDNTPLNNEICTYTAGQSEGTSGVSWTSGSITGVADTNTADWTITGVSPLLTLTDSNAAENPNQAAQAVTIVLSGFVNPNYTTCGGTQPNCTFFARILTYATTAGATAYSCNGSTCSIGLAESSGPLLDDGGIALSTAQTITITSKVQEQLIFCVYSGASCLAANNGFSLGDSTGVLYTSGAFTDISTKYTITTNASSGVVVRMLGNTLNGTGGTITAIGATAAQSNTGNDQFGLCTYGTGLTIPTLYNNTGNCNTVTQSSGTNTVESTGITAWYGFDLANTQSTYGSQIASTAGGGTFTGTIAFIGNVGITQTAGIYSTTLTFVCTGTY